MGSTAGGARWGKRKKGSIFEKDKEVLILDIKKE